MTAARLQSLGGQLVRPDLAYAFVYCGTTTSTTNASYIPYDTVRSSNGIVWNTSTYRFTVPVNGIYHMTGGFRINRNENWAYWYLNEDGVGSPYTDKLVLDHGEGTPAFTSAIGSMYAELTTGSEWGFGCYWTSTTTGDIHAGQTWMDIVFVG